MCCDTTFGSSGGFGEHEQCNQARLDISKEQRRELMNMGSATRRENKGSFCIYGTVDEIKSSV